MNIDIERFNEAKEDAEKFYNELTSIRCPYFQEEILFNRKGLEHIKFKDWNRTRLVEDQYWRLKLLKYAPEILKRSHTLQELRFDKRLERQRINSRWEQRLLQVSYYGFVSILDDMRIKVIVKEIEGGGKFFWSICPFWKTKRVAGENKKILHEGDLENQ